MLFRSAAPAAAALALYAGSAHAAPVFFNSLGDDLAFVNGGRIEARYRADVRNWDSRLEFDSFPDNGENQLGVGNGLSFFQSQDFDFALTYDNAANRVDWRIVGNGADVTADITPSGFGALNTIQLFTSGSRGSVTVTDLDFTGLGMDTNAFPNIDTRPSAEGGPTFKETFMFFGDGFDLLAGDWSLTGTLTFGTFTNNNPSEGSKITIKLREAETIPAPSAILALAGGLVISARRRRA